MPITHAQFCSLPSTQRLLSDIADEIGVSLVDTTQRAIFLYSLFSSSFFPIRPPIRLLRVQDSLARILQASFEHSQSNITFDDCSEEDIRAMLEHLKPTLKELAPPPKIAVHPSILNDRRLHLIQMITQMNAAYTEDVSTATHVIQDSLQDITDDEYFRTLDKRDGFILLHYWYKPDSKDVWELDSGDYLDPEPIEERSQFNVSITWLEQSHSHKEWMVSASPPLY